MKEAQRLKASVEASRGRKAAPDKRILSTPQLVTRVKSGSRNASELS